MITESTTEEFAQKHSDQWLGCCICKESHHKTGFCHTCGKCYYRLIGTNRCKNSEYGTFVYCECGENGLWD